LPAVEKYVRWLDGGARVVVSGDVLELVFRNARVVAEPRRLVLEGIPASPRCYSDGRRLRVALDLAGEPEPFRPPPRIDIEYTGMVGGFQVTYTSLGFDSYITIVTPGGHLYDYVVVSRRLVFLEASGRRKAFFEELGGGVAVYLA